MNIKYTEITPEQFIAEKHKLQNSVFKLLPYKENGYNLLDEYFESLLFKIGGLNTLIGGNNDLLSLMSIISAAKVETNFKKYRKAILDACSLIETIQLGGDGDV